MSCLQSLGTAMGTSAACMWATIYFAVREIGTLLSRYNRFMLLFKRFIGDMFGIWIGDGTLNAWENLKRDTKDFGILTWKCEEPATLVDFLGLTISIKHNKITTKTYQKALNRYQYILCSSITPRLA
ncbi:hypothetical protein ACHAXR_013248 [Thalassiosira sp. AJA248-18]